VFDLQELVAVGSVPLDGADLLRRLVAARTAFLVTGGTGTGKTTLLSALLSVVDVGDRVLLVEDAGELAPDHPHVVRLEARPANVEGAGAVTLRDLVRQALRMRPDRLVGGQIEGCETSAPPGAFSALPAPGGLCFSPARSPLGASAPSSAASPVRGLGRPAVPAGLWQGWARGARWLLARATSSGLRFAAMACRVGELAGWW